MSGTASDSDAETVITEGTTDGGKVNKEKGKVSHSTVMSPPAHKLSHLRSTHDPVPPSSPDIIFDRSFSTRSSVGESSPFRKFNISPPQLSIFNVEQFRVWALAFHAHLHRFHLDKILSPEANFSRSEERRVGKECRSRWSPYH